MYLYEIAPLDAPLGMRAPEEMRDVIKKNYPDYLPHFEAATKRATDILSGLRDQNWRESLLVSTIPHEYVAAFVFSRKLDNNGTTYVVSDVELPDLGGSLL